MKLKRFLLRYDPPGIGLEVEDEQQEMKVEHRDLPVSQLITTSKAVEQVADDLIEAEELLSAKRHRAALIQLLGRLYQVSSGEADDDDDGDDSKAESGNPGAKNLKEGQQIVLVGLKGQQQELNGELGTLKKLRLDKGKFEVSVKEEIVKVKGSEHIVPMAAKGTPLVVGAPVVIRGLRNHIELNGCLGRVVECHQENHRYEVRALESGQLFRVKQDNLLPVDSKFELGSIGAKDGNVEANSGSTSERKAAPTSAPPAAGGDSEVEGFIEPGSKVRLTGLKTAMSYNGWTAEVLSVDRIKGRYEISLPDGSVKTIRAENVTFVSGPTKSGRKQKDGKAA